MTPTPASPRSLRFAQTAKLMADVAPLSADERFEIEDMTDEEWQVFVDALDE
jgi:hypothetical protein